MGSIPLTRLEAVPTYSLRLNLTITPTEKTPTLLLKHSLSVVLKPWQALELPGLGLAY